MLKSSEHIDLRYIFKHKMQQVKLYNVNHNNYNINKLTLLKRNYSNQFNTLTKKKK